MRKSNDAGETWTDVLPRTGFQLTTVVVDPESPATVYVTGSFPAGAGIIKSTDGGESWKELPTFDALLVTQLAIHPEDSHLLFASLYSFNPFDLPKVIKSGDGGETWAVADAGLPNVANVWSIGVDPTRLSTVYAGTDFGFFVSDDGGTNWRLLSKGLGEGTVSQVLVDPFDPLTVYAGTSAGGGLFALTRSAPP